MYRSRRSAFLSFGAGLTLLFLLVSYRAGPFVATLFLVSGVLGYLNVFAALRAGLAVLKRRTVTRTTIILVLAAAAGSAALCYFGYWAPLALCTGSFLIIDGIALRFQGPPMGASVGEP